MDPVLWRCKPPYAQRHFRRHAGVIALPPIRNLQNAVWNARTVAQSAVKTYGRPGKDGALQIESSTQVGAASISRTGASGYEGEPAAERLLLLCCLDDHRSAVVETKDGPVDGGA